MKRRNVLILVTLVTLLIVSCTKRNGEGSSTGGTTRGPLFTAVQTIARTNCAVTGCHTTPNPQNGVNFSDDNTIVAEKNNIKLRAVDQAGTVNQMPQPPRPALSTSDRQKIVDWINAGGR